MIWQVFAVFDAHAGAYLQPFLMPTKGQAIQAFLESCALSEGQWKERSADLTLMHLGQFYAADGRLEAHTPPVRVGTAWDLYLPGSEAASY